jgi:hypothetical protein
MFMGRPKLAFDHRPGRFSGDKQYAPDVIQFAGHCRTFLMASRVVPGIGAQYKARLA